jgi:hypothetical protein
MMGGLMDVTSAVVVGKEGEKRRRQDELIEKGEMETR